MLLCLLCLVCCFVLVVWDVLFGVVVWCVVCIWWLCVVVMFGVVVV